MNKETKEIIRAIEEADKKEITPDGELEALRHEKKVKENLEKELEILTEVFPELKSEDIPDQVFEDCEDGKGLAARYALYYVKEQRNAAEKEKREEENRKSAPPEVKTSEESVYFTPEAVRAMSKGDIRKNYKAIMKSMEAWNK